MGLPKTRYCKVNKTWQDIKKEKWHEGTFFCKYLHYQIPPITCTTLPPLTFKMKCLAGPEEAYRDLLRAEKEKQKTSPFSDPRHSFYVKRAPVKAQWMKERFLWSVKEEEEEEEDDDDASNTTTMFESDFGSSGLSHSSAPSTDRTSISSTFTAPTLTKWQGKIVDTPPEARLNRPTPKAPEKGVPYLVIHHRRKRSLKQAFEETLNYFKEKRNIRKKQRLQDKQEDKGCDVLQFLAGKDKPKKRVDKGKRPAKPEQDEPIPEEILLFYRRTKLQRNSVCSCSEMDHSSGSSPRQKASSSQNLKLEDID